MPMKKGRRRARRGPAVSRRFPDGSTDVTRQDEAQRRRMDGLLKPAAGRGVGSGHARFPPCGVWVSSSPRPRFRAEPPRRPAAPMSVSGAIDESDEALSVCAFALRVCHGVHVGGFQLLLSRRLRGPRRCALYSLGPPHQTW